jgi:hypothetical protein
MTRSEFLAQFERIIEVPPASIGGTEELATLCGWDSVAKISFMAFMNQAFGVVVSFPKLLACTTVEELMRLSGEGQIEGYGMSLREH